MQFPDVPTSKKKIVFYPNAVTTVDTTPPVVTFCTESSTHQAPAGAQFLELTWREPTAVDDSGVPPESFKTHPLGYKFPIGDTLVQYVFADEAGNQAKCSFTITGK